MYSAQITDYLWSRSIKLEPQATDTIKPRSYERRWPGLALKSPGIRPRGLPGKHHPNPLPKIGSSQSRNSKDEAGSPLPSPNFGSPVSCGVKKYSGFAFIWKRAH